MMHHIKNAVTHPNCCTLREMGVSVSQHTSKILCRNPFSQVNHLFEPS